MWPFKKQKIVIIKDSKGIDSIYTSNENIQIEIFDFDKYKNKYGYFEFIQILKEKTESLIKRKPA